MKIDHKYYLKRICAINKLIYIKIERLKRAVIENDEQECDLLHKKIDSIAKRYAEIKSVRPAKEDLT